MVKKRVQDETVAVEEEAAVIEVQANSDANEEEENPEYERLLETLQQTRKQQPGFFGYILRSDSKAAVDLNDSSKIVEYAMLTSQAFESSEIFCSSFQLGDTRKIVILGKDTKVVCLDLGQNLVSLFLQKNLIDVDILAQLLPPE